MTYQSSLQVRLIKQHRSNNLQLQARRKKKKARAKKELRKLKDQKKRKVKLKLLQQVKQEVRKKKWHKNQQWKEKLKMFLQKYSHHSWINNFHWLKKRSHFHYPPMKQNLWHKVALIPTLHLFTKNKEFQPMEPTLTRLKDPLVK